MTRTAYKHIALTDDGVPVIEGTRFKVERLVAERRAHGSSAEELQLQHPQLTLAQIYSALAYYEDHRDEIDTRIREGGARADALESELDATDLKDRIRARTER